MSKMEKYIYLPYAEFKTLVIKILSELKGRAAELRTSKKR